MVNQQCVSGYLYHVRQVNLIYKQQIVIPFTKWDVNFSMLINN